MARALSYFKRKLRVAGSKNPGARDSGGLEGWQHACVCLERPRHPEAGFKLGTRVARTYLVAMQGASASRSRRRRPAAGWGKHKFSVSHACAHASPTLRGRITAGKHKMCLKVQRGAHRRVSSLALADKTQKQQQLHLHLHAHRGAAPHEEQFFIGPKNPYASSGVRRGAREHEDTNRPRTDGRLPRPPPARWRSIAATCADAPSDPVCRFRGGGAAAALLR